MTDNLSKSLKSTEHELSWANRGLKGNSAADGNHFSLIKKRKLFSSNMKSSQRIM
jgi:hypothetical protein